MSIGALILTGGASRRMGADKAVLDWDGATAVDRVWALAAATIAGPIFTVGRRGYDLPTIEDARPGGGPVAGVTTGATALKAQGAQFALVLAVDAPTITPEDLAPLVRCRLSAAYEGLHLPAVFRLADLPEAVGDGWPMKRLLEVVGATRLPVPAGAADRLRGANTPCERDLLQAH